MRTWLLVTGIAITVVGIGVLVAAFSITPGPSGSTLQHVSVPDLGAHQLSVQVISSALVSSASVVFSWSANQSLQVAIYVGAPCSPGNATLCPSGPAQAVWWSTTGGWTYTGAVTNPWLLKVYNPNATVAIFNATLVESYPATGSSGPAWTLLVLLLGSLFLLGIGALALFLGLFLRGGVYGGGRPPVPPPDAGILDDGLDDDLDAGPGELDDAPEIDR
ncbi:MAG TPA: hypothetical protein VEL82_06000 [Thermoplasmata archaeon]|nr:hypothetical protein [Thermoplasmata archaeon]